MTGLSGCQENAIIAFDVRTDQSGTGGQDIRAHYWIAHVHPHLGSRQAIGGEPAAPVEHKAKSAPSSRRRLPEAFKSRCEFCAALPGFGSQGFHEFAYLGPEPGVAGSEDLDGEQTSVPTAADGNGCDGN